jgi:succinylglutamic semialdehyde dehydrogenase
VSTSPSDASVVWEGREASSGDVDAAVAAAREAFPVWSDTPLEQRVQVLLDFASKVRSQSDELAQLISRETGKPLWEAKTEASAVAGKAQLSIDALHARRDEVRQTLADHTAVTRFKPHGVLAVLGPFNFPAHLPNGHIMPALLAGNAVVFKPSEMTPAVGQWMTERWCETALPPGAINLVQGGRETGGHLAMHPEIDGLLFTGSSSGGRALHRAFGQWPQKVLALEMGGNNPLVVHRPDDPLAAAYAVVVSSFLTAGQRCTCARRLIVVEDAATRDVVDQLVGLMKRLRVGLWTDRPEPFMGTVITSESARRVLEAQAAWIRQGGRPLVAAHRHEKSACLLTPGLVDTTEVASRPDEEVFGPLLQLIRVPDFDAAVQEANRTAYGLAAGLLSRDSASYELFIRRVRAGIVNWNRPTTGASGALPFGGCGLSGNNRPAGAFSADYCSWPVASMESESLGVPEQTLPGVEL